MVRWFRSDKSSDTTNIKFKGVKRSKPYEEPPPAYRPAAPVVEQVVIERIEEPQPEAEPEPEPEPEPVVQYVPSNGLMQNIFVKIKRDRLTKFLLALLLGILLLLLFLSLFGSLGNIGPRIGLPGSGGPTPKEVMIGSTTCKARLAITNDEQLQGLRFTPSLAPDECMIYIFSQPDRYPFWGKDMRYPMDIIFISGDNMVTDLVENIPPCDQSDCPIYKPDRPARYAIEVNAGYVDTFDIGIGDPVVFRY